MSVTGPARHGSPNRYCPTAGRARLPCMPVPARFESAPWLLLGNSWRKRPGSQWHRRPSCWPWARPGCSLARKIRYFGAVAWHFWSPWPQSAGSLANRSHAEAEHGHSRIWRATLPAPKTSSVGGRPVVSSRAREIRDTRHSAGNRSVVRPRCRGRSRAAAELFHNAAVVGETATAEASTRPSARPPTHVSPRSGPIPPEGPG